MGFRYRDSAPPVTTVIFVLIIYKSLFSMLRTMYIVSKYSLFLPYICLCIALSVSKFYFYHQEVSLFTIYSLYTRIKDRVNISLPFLTTD